MSPFYLTFPSFHPFSSSFILQLSVLSHFLSSNSASFFLIISNTFFHVLSHPLPFSYTFSVTFLSYTFFILLSHLYHTHPLFLGLYLTPISLMHLPYTPILPALHQHSLPPPPHPPPHQHSTTSPLFLIYCISSIHFQSHFAPFTPLCSTISVSNRFARCPEGREHSSQRLRMNQNTLYRSKGIFMATYSVRRYQFSRNVTHLEGICETHPQKTQMLKLRPVVKCWWVYLPLVLTASFVYCPSSQKLSLFLSLL